MFGWQHLSAEERETIARGIVEKRVLGGPYHLEIHPTNKCNVNCFFCFCKPYRHGESLPWEVTERVLREGAARGLRFLRISGGGESLLYPQIGPLLDLCGELGLRIVDLTTNGTRLGPLAEKLVQVGTDFTIVSINEADPARHSRMMGVAEKMFHQAVEGIEALCRERDAAPEGRKPVVAMQFLVWGENYMHLAQMYELGKQLDVDQIVIKRVGGDAPELAIPPEAIPGVRRTLIELLQDDCQVGACRLRFDLSAEKELHLFVTEEQLRRLPAGVKIGPDFTEPDPRIHYCYMGWFSTLVAANGSVFPCCPLMELPGKELGNVHRQSLAEIWEGESYRRFRGEFEKLMLVRGELEPCRRLQRFLEPICIKCFGCLYGFNLCSPEFYADVAQRVDARTAPHERALAQGRNALVRGARKAAAGLRKKLGRG